MKVKELDTFSKILEHAAHVVKPELAKECFLAHVALEKLLLTIELYQGYQEAFEKATDTYQEE